MWKQEQNEKWEKEQHKEARKQGKETEKQDKQLLKDIERAKKEGVVVSEWGEDGEWWAKINEDGE